MPNKRTPNSKNLEEKNAENAIRRIRKSHNDLLDRIAFEEEREKQKYISAVKSHEELSEIMKESTQREKLRKDLEIQKRNAETIRISQNAEILRSKMDQNQANFVANQRRASARNRTRIRKEEKRISDMLNQG